MGRTWGGRNRSTKIRDDARLASVARGGQQVQGKREEVKKVEDVKFPEDTVMIAAWKELFEEVFVEYEK